MNLRDEYLFITLVGIHFTICIFFAKIVSYESFHYLFISDVLPPHQGSHEFVLAQRKEQYENLREALDVMRRISDGTSPAELHLKMYLLQEGLLPFDEQKMVISSYFYLQKSQFGFGVSWQKPLNSFNSTFVIMAPRYRGPIHSH